MLLHRSLQSSAWLSRAVSRELTYLSIFGTRLSSRPLFLCGYSSQCLTSRAAESFPLLSPLGVAQDVDDERGELPSVEASQLLTALRAERGGS